MSTNPPNEWSEQLMSAERYRRGVLAVILMATFLLSICPFAVLGACEAFDLSLSRATGQTILGCALISLLLCCVVGAAFPGLTWRERVGVVALSIFTSVFLNVCIGLIVGIALIATDGLSGIP